jgi:hypothetical protein
VVNCSLQPASEFLSSFHLDADSHLFAWQAGPP